MVFLAARVGFYPVEQHIKHFLGPGVFIYLGGCEFALTNHFKAEIILNVGLSRSLNNVRHKVGGYKQHAAAGAAIAAIVLFGWAVFCLFKGFGRDLGNDDPRDR